MLQWAPAPYNIHTCQPTPLNIGPGSQGATRHTVGINITLKYRYHENTVVKHDDCGLTAAPQAQQDAGHQDVDHLVHSPELRGHVHPLQVEPEQDLQLRDQTGLRHGLRDLLLVHAAAQLHGDRPAHQGQQPARGRLGPLVHECAQGASRAQPGICPQLLPL